MLFLEYWFFWCSHNGDHNEWQHCDVSEPTLILVVVPPAILLTLASCTELYRSHGVKLLFGENLNLEKAELHAVKQVFTTFGNMNMLMGWMGVAIGAVAMANSNTGENVSQVFGPAFSVCVLTLLYALLIKALYCASEAKIQFKNHQSGLLILSYKLRRFYKASFTSNPCFKHLRFPNILW